MPWLTPDEHTRRVEEARDIALRRLDRCAAPRAVLARTLERRGVDPRAAREALDRLEAAGVVDDRAYAAALARTRFAEKGAARRAIAEELRLKGVGEGPIRAALARRKLASTRGLEPAVRRRRALALLGRKGYPAQAAADAVDAAIAEES